MKKQILLLVAIPVMASGYTPTNLDQPYDVTFSEQSWLPQKRLMHVGVRSEMLVDTKAYDPEENEVSATQIWGQKESGLAMLEGEGAGGTLHALGNRIRGMQDGTCGTYTVTGDYTHRTATLDLCIPVPISLPGLFMCGIHIPFHEALYKNIKWVSNTQSTTIHDALVNATLGTTESSLASFTQKYGGLSIGGVSKQGFGDVAVMFSWQGFFTQYNRRLKNVRVQLRGGVSIPTSATVDRNNAFEIDFGHDNTVTIPLGAGLRLDLGDGVRVGVDVGMTSLARRTGEWRLKTSNAQTENLLLQLGKATREYGPEWKFTLYSQAYYELFGITLTAGYQFFKHTDSTFYTQDTGCSSALINTSQTTLSSESHNVIGSLEYTPALLRGWRMRPELHFGIKWPFNGRRMLSGSTISGSFSVRF